MICIHNCKLKKELIIYLVIKQISIICLAKCLWKIASLPFQNKAKIYVYFTFLEPYIWNYNELFIVIDNQTNYKENKKSKFDMSWTN